jgi:hypothetical protein
VTSGLLAVVIVAKFGTSYKPVRSSRLDNIFSTKNILRKLFRFPSNTSGGLRAFQVTQTKVH